MSTNGLFVISLDFELYWGMFDKVTLLEYGENIKGVHFAIPEILNLFRTHNIHATWATVGMLMFENKTDLFASLPKESLEPQYDQQSLSAYQYIKSNPIAETNDLYHFGGHLVTEILATQHQELGSHTFSHFYCLDGSKNSKTIFSADCEAFKRASQKFGETITSIVFPRNQTTPLALEVCKEHGFTSYRGTPNHFLYTGKREEKQSNPFLRIMRLCDAYVNLSGHHTYSLSEIKESTLFNVRGSSFLRPYSRTLKAFEKIRISRIKKSMTYAAKHNEVYHLWWHPHNFGINRKENLLNLQEIIAHYQFLQKTYGMQSANMREVTELHTTHVNG